MRLSSVPIRLAEILVIVRYEGEAVILSLFPPDGLGIHLDEDCVADAIFLAMVRRSPSQGPFGHTLLDRVSYRPRLPCGKKAFNLVHQIENGVGSGCDFVIDFV